MGGNKFKNAPHVSQILLQIARLRNNTVINCKALGDQFQYRPFGDQFQSRLFGDQFRSRLFGNARFRSETISFQAGPCSIPKVICFPRMGKDNL